MFRVLFSKPKPTTKWIVPYSLAKNQQGRILFQRRNIHKNVIVLQETANKNINQANDIINSIKEKQILENKQPKKKNDLPQQNTKQTLWQKIKTEAVHYWHGTKLLGLEVRISSRLIYKLLQGNTLTRRENRQVTYSSINI